MKIINVVGARPNFMKIAPIFDEMKRQSAITRPILLHTGQHYDEKMSDLFFRDLGLPQPDIYLGVGSGSHAQQTAEIMCAFEDALNQEHPDLVLVVGDVNSTLACSIVAAKLHIPIAHVEAGLRSFDRRMPEEINRILTDSISDYLFVTEKSGVQNLTNEGVPSERIFLVGNVMIDSLLRHVESAKNSQILEDLGLKPGHFALITLHRPENVDHESRFEGILGALKLISRRLPVVFPIHPRTRKMLDSSALSVDGLRICEPVGYLDFVKLMTEAAVVMTDSGGIQEETTILGVPCLTLRDSTERPVTLTHGTNRIVGTDRNAIVESVEAVLDGAENAGTTPELWDGRAAERIVDVILKGLTSSDWGVHRPTL